MIRGTRKEKPARTKKAAPNPSQRGPVERASQEKAAARKMHSVPLINQPRDGFTERSSLVPPFRASTGSCCAAAWAGNQAETITDPIPIIPASAKLHSGSAISRTLTST